MLSGLLYLPTLFLKQLRRGPKDAPPLPGRIYSPAYPIAVPGSAVPGPMGDFRNFLVQYFGPY